jgi:NO-binding membrane sensor protein with MHYT domain
VALSFVIAAVGAFVALTASAGIVQRGRRISLFNALTAGTALGGIGVWAMHFVGMLSLQVNMAVSYSLPETVLSLVAAVGASTVTLLWVARRPDSLPRVLGAGVLLGLGVTAMHYVGMAGMRFGGYVQWSWPAVAVSVAIAVTAATTALWLAFAVRSLRARAVASAVMAAAVCAMHYTGMEAASFICTTAAPLNFPLGGWLLPSLDLPMLVSIAAFGMAFLIFTDQMFQRLE